MPIVTQAIPKRQKEAGKIGQPELEFGKAGAIGDGDGIVLRGCLVGDMHYEYGPGSA